MMDSDKFLDGIQSLATSALNLVDDGSYEPMSEELNRAAYDALQTAAKMLYRPKSDTVAERDARLLEAVERLGHATVKLLSRETGLHHTSVGKGVRDLVKAGRLVKFGGDCYRLCE